VRIGPCAREFVWALRKRSTNAPNLSSTCPRTAQVFLGHRVHDPDRQVRPRLRRHLLVFEDGHQVEVERESTRLLRHPEEAVLPLTYALQAQVGQIVEVAGAERVARDPAVLGARVRPDTHLVVQVDAVILRGLRREDDQRAAEFRAACLVPGSDFGQEERIAHVLEGGVLVGVVAPHHAAEGEHRPLDQPGRFVQVHRWRDARLDLAALGDLRHSGGRDHDPVRHFGGSRAHHLTRVLSPKFSCCMGKRRAVHTP
jgi:hypothetical protein